MHLKEALHRLHVDIANTNAELLTNMIHKMGEICEVVNQTNQRILAQQEVQTTMMVELVSMLRSLGEKLDSLLPSPFSVPTPTPPTTSVPLTSTMLFTMSDPSTSTQFHITMDEPSIPTSTPIISDLIPTGSLPLEDPLLQPASPKPHHSSTSTDTTIIEEIEVPDPLQPPHTPLFVPYPQDSIQVPPLNLPEPISFDTPSFTTPEEDTHDTSSPIQDIPLSIVGPSSQPPPAPLRSKPSSLEHVSLSDDTKKGEKD